MGEVDKLTLPLEGRPLLAQTLQPFLNYDPIGWVVVAANPERLAEFEALFREQLGPAADRIKVTAGGEHRQQSILNALRLLKEQKLSSPEDPIMIHDGARPFVTEQLFNDLLEKLEQYDGVIPALPVRDTIKRVQGNKVLHTEDRETLRLVQTPQVFPFSTILELHERAAEEEFLGTDDASLLEKYGKTVGWVDGPSYNLKVTIPEDIALLSHLYQGYKQPI